MAALLAAYNAYITGRRIVRHDDYYIELYSGTAEVAAAHLDASRIEDESGYDALINACYARLNAPICNAQRIAVENNLRMMYIRRAADAQQPNYSPTSPYGVRPSPRPHAISSAAEPSSMGQLIAEITAALDHRMSTEMMNKLLDMLVYFLRMRQNELEILRARVV